MVNKNKAKIDTRDLTKAAFLTATSIVLTRFIYFFVPLGGANTLRISFGEMPLMMIGLFFGPAIGGIGGVAADLIGVLINPQGVFHPGFTLSSMLWGVIPGLFSLIYKKKETYEKIYSVMNIGLAVFVTYVIISLVLNTLWLSSMFGKGFMVLLPGRLINAAVSIPLQTIIISTVFKHLKRFIN